MKSNKLMNFLKYSATLLYIHHIRNIVYRLKDKLKTPMPVHNMKNSILIIQLVITYAYLFMVPILPLL